ncbi:MAG TPA: hypothetical protein VKQ73_07130 [Stellaceae bacterium]|nr:hypothetical protein [Stellaceae bacterium]
MTLMHEWVLLSIVFDWKTGRLTLSFDTDPAGVVSLVAEGVVDLHVPQLKPWGSSVHVNEVREPQAGARKRRKLEIEMQSGDIITIKAASFAFPPGVHRSAASLETTTHRG